MKKVLVESPFGAPTWEEILSNIRYARACLRYCFLHDAAPFASHLIYTQPGVLDDFDTDERSKGIEAGLMWGNGAEETWVFTDMGITSGMEQGIARAEKEGRPVKRISLGADWEEKWLGSTKERSFA